MKKLILLSILFITSCYLANGSPASSNYWVKNGKKISHLDIKKCFEKNKLTLQKRDKERFEYLENRYKELGYSNDGFSVMRTKYPNEYQEYIDLRKLIPSNASCYYDIGYRFKAPLQWCLAQDGDNTKICMENMKYRN